MSKLIRLCLAILFAGTLARPLPAGEESPETKDKPVATAPTKKAPEEKKVHKHKHRLRHLLMRALGKLARKGY